MLVRRHATVLIAVVLGLLTTVAVAWGFALWFRGIPGGWECQYIDGVSRWNNIGATFYTGPPPATDGHGRLNTGRNDQS